MDRSAAIVALWVIVAWLDVTQQAVNPRAEGEPLHLKEALYLFLQHAP